MTAFRAKTIPVCDADLNATKLWFFSVGMSWPAKNDVGKGFEIELGTVPEVLLQIYHLQGYLPVSRITHEGVVFYLTDIPLWPKDGDWASMTKADSADGYLFCPMSNVVCINEFGRIYGVNPRVDPLKGVG